MIKRNIGNLDTVIRLILAVIIITLGIMYESWWGLVGVVPLMTAIIGTCPIYGILGISTAKQPRKAR